MEKIIHQVWVGPYEMPDREKHFIEVMKEKNPTFEHRLWTDANLPDLPEEIKSKIQVFSERKDFVFVADMIRVIVLKMFGGMYIDADHKCHIGIENWDLEKYDGLLIYHDTYTFGNDCFGAKANTGYINYLYDDIVKTTQLDFLPYWFNKKVKEYFNIEDVADERSDHATIVGQEALKMLEVNNVKTIRRHGDFHARFEHYGLQSWFDHHKQYFAEGKINYADELYKKPW